MNKLIASRETLRVVVDSKTCVRPARLGFVGSMCMSHTKMKPWKFFKFRILTIGLFWYWPHV